MRKFYVLILLCFLTSHSYAQILEVGNIDKNLLLGKINYGQADDFVKVDPRYASKPMFLNKQVYRAFINMFNNAVKDGVKLQIISGARNFEYQKSIWERKWKKYADLDPECRTEEILKFSSMPATSRHHWGTDIDLNYLENEYFDSGPGQRVYQWLVENAHRYGFYQVYDSQASGRTGYAEEKWHWSYLPLAGPYLDRYNQIISYRDINGFEGAHMAKAQRMIPAYVNGIANPKLPQPATEASEEVAVLK